VAIIKKRLDLTPSLYTILQILSVSVFEKVPIHQALTESTVNVYKDEIDNQLTMFNL